MTYIITRTNGKVTQIWSDNKASWSFFMNGMSSDVEWKNETNQYFKPRQFKSEGEANWYLNKRAERLKFREKSDQGWTYTIKEYVDVVHQ